MKILQKWTAFVISTFCLKLRMRTSFYFYERGAKPASGKVGNLWPRAFSFNRLLIQNSKIL